MPYSQRFRGIFFVAKAKDPTLRSSWITWRPAMQPLGLAVRDAEWQISNSQWWDDDVLLLYSAWYRCGHFFKDSAFLDQTEQKMKAIFGGRDGITFFLHDSNLIYINLHYSLFRMPFFDYVVIFWIHSRQSTLYHSSKSSLFLTFSFAKKSYEPNL